jgi:hypothetical protein
MPAENNPAKRVAIRCFASAPPLNIDVKPYGWVPSARHLLPNPLLNDSERAELGYSPCSTAGGLQVSSIIVGEANPPPGRGTSHFLRSAPGRVCFKKGGLILPWERSSGRNQSGGGRASLPVTTRRYFHNLRPISLLLARVGLYAVVDYGVSQRRQEISALTAAPSGLLPSPSELSQIRN